MFGIENIEPGHSCNYHRWKMPIREADRDGEKAKALVLNNQYSNSHSDTSCLWDLDNYLTSVSLSFSPLKWGI